MKIVHKVGLAIFFLVVGVYTMTINSWNADKFLLQNATVASLVERKSFTLVDKIVPNFYYVVGEETFRIGELIYPMKQPGQTVLGALVYAPLYYMGFDYDRHFHYVSNIVTFFTSTLMMASTTVILYYLASHMTKSIKLGTMVGLSFAFGTIIWSYAGVSHHDIYGTFWGVLSFGCYYLARQTKNIKYYFGAGFFATLILFFTMLPLTFSLVMLGVTLITKKREAIKRLGLGMMAGLIPTILYNTILFGKPWLPPNLAGKVADTMPLLSIGNFVQKLWFYLLAPTSSIFLFMPFLIFGILGTLKVSSQKLWLKQLLIYVPLFQLIHIASIETFGGYQYGPRYLLTIIPYLCLGVGFYLQKKKSGFRLLLFYLALGYSVFVAFLGSVRTVMYEVPGPYAPGIFIKQLLYNEGPEFRLFGFGGVVTGVALILAYKLRKELRVAKIR